MNSVNVANFNFSSEFDYTFRLIKYYPEPYSCYLGDELYGGGFVMRYELTHINNRSLRYDIEPFARKDILQLIKCRVSLKIKSPQTRGFCGYLEKEGFIELEKNKN